MRMTQIVCTCLAAAIRAVKICSISHCCFGKGITSFGRIQISFDLNLFIHHKINVEITSDLKKKNINVEICVCLNLTLIPCSFPYMSMMR
jgi:hypothetical protein